MMELGVPNAQIILAAEQTLYMVFVSLAIGTVIAVLLAVTLVLTNPHGILTNRTMYAIVNTCVTRAELADDPALPDAPHGASRLSHATRRGV